MKRVAMRTASIGLLALLVLSIGNVASAQQKANPKGKGGVLLDPQKFVDGNLQRYRADLDKLRAEYIARPCEPPPLPKPPKPKAKPKPKPVPGGGWPPAGWVVGPGGKLVWVGVAGGDYKIELVQVIPIRGNNPLNRQEPINNENGQIVDPDDTDAGNGGNQGAGGCLWSNLTGTLTGAPGMQVSVSFDVLTGQFSNGGGSLNWFIDPGLTPAGQIQVGPIPPYQWPQGGNMPEFKPLFSDETVTITSGGQTWTIEFNAQTDRVTVNCVTSP